MYFIMFIGLASACIIFSLPLRFMWKHKLSVTLHFSDNYIYEGDESNLREVIINNKWLPLPALEVRTSFDPHLRFTGEAKANSGVSDTTYKRDIFSLLYHQKVTRNLSFKAHRRGRYEIRETAAHAYDYFFRSIGYFTLPQDTCLYVYPAQVDARRIDIICTAISGSRLVQNQLFPDPFEFAGIREYLPSDPMNRINWKASVRMGKTLVNKFDSTTNMDITLAFDVEDSRIIKEDDLVEETIRIVSSLSARLVANRMPVNIISNAAELPSLKLPANASHMNELNRKLACINTEKYTSALADLLGEIKLNEGGAGVLVLVSKNTDTELIARLEQTASFCPVLWILPCRKTTLISPRGVSLFRWEVES